MRDRIPERASDVVIVVAILLLLAVASIPAQTPPAQQGRELSLADVLIALRSKKADIGEKNKLLAEAIKERGITFALTPEIEKELDGTGAANELIAAIKQKTPAPPVSKPAPAEVKPVEDFAFFRDRAAAELKDGKNDAAIADLEKAIAMNPTDAGVRHDHALLLATKNDLEASANEYSKAAELAPQDVRNFIGRAGMYDRMGKAAEALADYQKVLTMNPADKDAGAAVVRISSAMTKAAMDLAAKQQPVVEKKAEPASSSTPTAANDGTTAKNDPPKPQPADSGTASIEPSGPINAGNLLSYCTDPVKPIYPSSAMALRASGEVTVNVSLDADGHVVDAKAMNGPGTLRAAAEAAAKRSKYKPVARNGKPVSATGTMTYTFKM